MTSLWAWMLIRKEVLELNSVTNVLLGASTKVINAIVLISNNTTLTLQLEVTETLFDSKSFIHHTVLPFKNNVTD